MEVVDLVLGRYKRQGLVLRNSRSQSVGNLLVLVVAVEEAVEVAEVVVVALELVVVA